MSTPQTKVSPEFNAACDEYFSLKRIGLGRSLLALAARRRMVDNAPTGVVDLLLQNQAAATEAINKAAGKGGVA